MIDLYITSKLIEDVYFNFGYSLNQITAGELEAVPAADIGGAVFFTRYEESFDKLVETFLSRLLEENDLFLVFVENFLSTRSKVRSYRGMLKPVRSQLGESNLWEKEILFDENQSAFAATVRLTPGNLEFCMRHLRNSTLVFGLITEKEAPSFPEVYPTFFLELRNMGILRKDRIILNFWKLFLYFLNSRRMLFRLRAVGIDHQALEIFGKNAVLGPAVSSLFEHLEKILYLRRRDGVPAEL